jgi:hypothetical protein
MTYPYEVERNRLNRLARDTERSRRRRERILEGIAVATMSAGIVTVLYLIATRYGGG